MESTPPRGSWTKNMPWDIGLRDVSKFMREHNVLSCSKGYIQRVTQSYDEVTIDRVRKYFLNTLKFTKLYLKGETVYTVNDRMK